MADNANEPYWEVSKKTGNKRYVTFDAQGNKQYGEVVSASGDVVAQKAAGMTYQEAQGSKGLENLNKLRANVGLPPAKDVKTGIHELQEYSGKNYNELVTDYMINRSPKPNARLEEKLKILGYPATKEGAKKAYEDKALTKEAVIDAYKDDKWHFRAIAPKQVKVSRAKYDELMKRPGAVKQGDKSYFSEDPANYHEYTEYVPEDAEVKTTIADTSKKEDTDPGAIVTDKEINPVRSNGKAPWWLQDIIKTAGAAADLARIKRYQPWQANPDVRLPEATFYDPNRELAANTEQANLAMQAQQAFTNPQQLAAASSATQGQAAKNAADVMARYNNMNVGVANELSKEQASILNVASQNKAANDTQLWDKYQTLNQNFDNSKALARQNLRQSYMDAITNRANTANLNDLYPNYAINPSNGGRAYFKGSTVGINPTRESDPYDAYWKKAQTMSLDPNIQERLFGRMIGKGAGTDSRESYGENPYDQYQNKP